MRYKIFIILFLLFYVAQTAAGEKRYRVEILVLSHIHHEAIPAEAGSIRDFSSSLDFLKVIDEEDDDEAVDDETTRDEDSDAELLVAEEPSVEKPGADEPQATDLGVTQATPEQETDAELLPEENQPEDPWADVVTVQEMSDVMREAWRRLRLSAPFRPEQYLAWEQSADDPFPSLRIHDQEVILIDDPYAELRETDADEAEEDAAEDLGVKLQEGEGRPVVFTDQGSLLPGNANDVTIEDALRKLAEEPELPDPTLFYRLDGTVMLRRSRFLHLDIDIELRQAVFDEQALTAAPVLSEESEPGESEPPLPSSFLIHQIKQNRQVKSQRMEYFDSPVLGVLLWITPFELEDEAETESVVD